ncbi:3339_t:CDS:2 [Cetraspora pellucida]|uniref:3339_t:CDS:1 n=1 Tax=Cetraspora pellucida TaxID=1433469 RepID=A0A9N9N511_9GLOM|nr:3339_t:CDS:2 [Cetraspora pellucida]
MRLQIHEILNTLHEISNTTLTLKLHEVSSNITSLTLTNWLTVFLFITLSYTAKYYLSYFTRNNPLPGPLPFPIIGNAYLFRGDLAELFLKLQAKYGPIFEIYFGSKRLIWLGDAKLLKKLNDPSPKSNFPYRAIGPWIDEVKMTSMGMSLNNHMSSWRFNRSMLGRSLLVPSLVHIMEKAFIELEGYWIILSKGNKVMKIDIADWIYKFTSDTLVPTVTKIPTANMLTHYNYLRKNNSNITFEQQQAIEMWNRIRIWQKSIVFFYCFPKFLRHYIPPFTFLNSKYLYNINWLNEYFINIVKLRRKEIENTPKGETLSSDILTSLICSNTHLSTQFGTENDEYGRPMTDEEIMRVTIEAITSSTNPLGSGISFTVYNIAKNPAVQSKVHDEIDRVLGKDMNRPVTYDDIIKLDYLEACIKESLRLTPVVPFIFKASDKEDTVAGLKWKAQQEFFIHIYYIHKSKAHWHDPESFIPERFLGNENIEESSHLPFGGGLRTCPGRHIALTSAAIFLTLILRKYKIELVDNKSFSKSYDLDYRCDKLEVYLRLRSE